MGKRVNMKARLKGRVRMRGRISSEEIWGRVVATMHQAVSRCDLWLAVGGWRIEFHRLNVCDFLKISK